MEICPICGEESSSGWVSCDEGLICYDCFEKERAEKLVSLSREVKTASGFKSWSGSDLSELFWTHLAKYQKKPTQEGVETMNLIFQWAVHDNHTLSNTMLHALKWCGIDLYAKLE